jgi:hypothetical protein
MTYLLQKNGYLESLKHRASVSSILKKKLDAARLGYGEEIGQEEEIDEEDETQLMTLFQSQVNKLISKPLAVAKFYTEFPDKYIPYFSSVFPKLQNMYRGTSPDPFVLKNVAIGLIEKLLQSSPVNNQQQAQASKSTPFRETYFCKTCEVEMLKTSKSNHDKSDKHQRNLMLENIRNLPETPINTKINIPKKISFEAV